MVINIQSSVFKINIHILHLIAKNIFVFFAADTKSGKTYF